jgi:hypothetical protein
LYTSLLEICSEHTLFLSIDDDNYDCVFYSIDGKFISEENSTINIQYVNNNSNNFSILYIKEEEDIYSSIRSLFLNNKSIPIMYREMAVNSIVDKWNTNNIIYSRTYDLISNS